MRKVSGVVCSLVVVAGLAGYVGTPAGAAPEPTPPSVAGLNPQAGATEGNPGSDQMIVHFAPGSGPGSTQLPLPGTGKATTVRKMDDGGWVLKLPEVYSDPSGQVLASAWTALPGVISAEPDAKMYALTTPNDTRFNEQWDFLPPTAGNQGANLTAAWDITKGSSSVVTAVIDTGYTDHVDLSGRFLPGYDFIGDTQVANDGNGRDADAHDPGDWVTAAEDASGYFAGCGVDNSSWHGTHVSGTIGANGNNGVGVAGINWNSKIVPLRVLGKCGGYTSDIADAIRWGAGLAVSGVPNNPNPASVENISLGGSGACDSTTQDAITAATNAGTLVVVAAGNSNADMSGFNPANCTGVLAVASVGKAGNRAYYSNFGANVGIAAQGGDGHADTSEILSTMNAGTQGPTTDTYVNYQGTSMATPHVVGVASLIKSVKPSATPAQITAYIRNTATPFPAGSTCTTALCGPGILNAAAAVAAASATTGQLRVTTTPAVPSMVSVDGVERDEFGLNWVPYAPGSHQVCFGPVTGYTAPACQTVSVTVGATTTVNGTFTQLGYLKVNTSPAVASTISIDGVDINEYGAWIPTTAGSHTVCYGAVAGYNAPSCTNGVVTAGNTTTVTGTFTVNASAPGPAAGYGLLRVTTSPAVGATILVDGVARDPWGLNWLKISAGSHSVCFAPFAGASGPSCQTVSVTAGNTTTVTGAFQVKGSLRAITSPAVNATITVDGVDANNYGVWRTNATGSHTVCFGAVPGYTAPACRSVSVTAGTSVTTTGTYTAS